MPGEGYSKGRHVGWVANTFGSVPRLGVWIWLYGAYPPSACMYCLWILCLLQTLLRGIVVCLCVLRLGSRDERVTFPMGWKLTSLWIMQLGRYRIKKIHGSREELQNGSGKGMEVILNGSRRGVGVVFLDRIFFFFKLSSGTGTGRDFFLWKRDGTGVKIHYPVTLYWPPVQSVPCPSPQVSWDRFQ